MPDILLKRFGVLGKTPKRFNKNVKAFFLFFPIPVSSFLHPLTFFLEKSFQIVCQFKNNPYICNRNSGCSSARLEYASGGRVVAGSNPVTPTGGKGLIIKRLSVLF